MSNSTKVLASGLNTSRPTAIAKARFSNSGRRGTLRDLPMGPAHSIAFARSFLYSGPFAFCKILRSNGMMDE